MTTARKEKETILYSDSDTQCLEKISVSLTRALTIHIFNF
jgi:hypothetical protein